MKGKYVMICWLAAVLASCGNSAPMQVAKMMGAAETKLVQVKSINGFQVQMTYLPQGKQEEEWNFMITVTEPGELKPREAKEMSYGLDTLFHLVNGADTIPALHAMRVTNGNIGGKVYMVMFPQLPHAGSDLRLLYADWLFTQRYLEFPLSVSSIKKLDSLSARL